MNNKLINCTRVSVDCVINDPIDVNAGGPVYLGFDFNIPTELTTEMKVFIAETLDILNVPIICINSNEETIVSLENISTKEKIVKAISKDAEYLKHVGARNYQLEGKSK